jgi:photosystem II stability/assembly factor-like uncharacterized protein
MAPKIKRTLIPLIILLLLLCTSPSQSAGQTSNSSILLPIIGYDPGGWIGPSGGTIVAIAIDPIRTNVIYAGSFGSGVYKSEDGGKTWISTSQGLTNLYINSLAVDPVHPSIIYAGTYKDQIYKSTDGGGSWKWSGAGMQADAIVYSIAIDPDVPKTVYAATRGISNSGSAPWNGVLYKSTNGGGSWQISRENMGGTELQDWVYSVIVNPHANNQVLIASHQSGPFRSSDYGVTWKTIHDGIGDDSGRAIVIAPQPEYPVICFYGVWHEDTLFKSTNGCTLWAPANQGIPYQHVYSIAVHPYNPDNVFLATFRSGILKSTDGGTSWQSGGLSKDDVYSVVIDPQSPSNMLAGTSGDGVYLSTNSAASWRQSSNGIQNAMTTAVVHDSNDPVTIYASVFGSGVYRYNYRHPSWVNISSGLTDKFVWDLVANPTNPRILYALTNEGGLFRIDLDAGSGWVPVGSGLPQTQNIQMQPLPPDHPFATLEMQEPATDETDLSTESILSYAPLMKMVFAPSDRKVAYMATDGSGVWVSKDGGGNWSPTGLNSGTILSIAVDLANSSKVYAATTLGGSIRVTTNGGQSWSYIPLEHIFYALLASPIEPGVLYAGTNDGLWRYESNSSSWTQLGLAGKSVTAVTVDPAHTNRIYAGTTKGAYASTDGGLTWNFANNDMNGITIDAISIDSFNSDLVYYSSTTHGIFLLASDN